MSPPRSTRAAASTGRPALPPPPDPSSRLGTRQTAHGALADAFFRTLGLDAMDEAAAERDRHAAHVARYTNDPVTWCLERAQAVLWSKQRAILESIRDNRRTAVRSAHGTGKSFVAGCAAAYWIDAHPPGEAFVVVSAPTEAQIKAVLWKELRRAHSAAGMGGRITQLEWHMQMPHGEELVAFGRKPADLNPTAFQGIHTKYVLVIFDEACAMHSVLWDAADSLISNRYSRFLATGNPDDPQSEFERVCRPGSGWNVIGISVFDSPNFTGEEVPDKARDEMVSPLWEQEKLRKWGKSNPQYIARVLGEFPTVAEGGLIPAAWIRAAQSFDPNAQHPVAPPVSPVELGVDVGAGGDKTTVALRRGAHVRIIHRGQNPDTMQTLGLVLRLIEEHHATAAKVDVIGIGKGVVDRAAELASDQRQPAAVRARARAITGINVGQAANDRDAYVNLRAEAYWTLRERFQAATAGNWADAIVLDPSVEGQPGEVGKPDEDLAAQLVDLSFKTTSHGKIQIESKDDMKRRGKPSPDDADALVLAFCGGRKRLRGGTWGRGRNKGWGLRTPVD